MEEGWVNDKELGPVDEDRLLALVNAGKIKNASLIRSPELTNGQWCHLSQMLGQLQEAARQRERARLAAEEERLRRERIRQENLNRLTGLVRQVVADGRVTTDERQLVSQFSQKAQIPAEEVQRIFQLEGNRLLSQILQQALSDGEFSPDEEEQLRRVSAGIGIPFAFDDATEAHIELAKLCWLFNNCELDEFPTIESPFKLQSKERCFGVHAVEWNAVRRSTAKRGPSMRLAPVGVGNAFVTDKRIVFVTEMDSKSIRHTSIAKVERYTNGTLLVRSSGGNVFLKFTAQSFEDHKFALLLERVCVTGTGKLAATLPASEFKTYTEPPPVVAQTVEYHAGVVEPRYTFRVVGSHIGNRQACIDALSIGEPLYFVREPSNPVDHNAVAILDSRRNHLGYLKRDVAEWFAPKIDRGERFHGNVHRLRSDGGLIVGVLET